MAIEYRIKNNIEYAMISHSVRVGDKVSKSPRINLGRVIDKEKGIFKNRERGLFVYNIETDEYTKVPPEYIEPTIKRKKKYRDREILEIEFGKTFFFDKFVSAIGFWNVVDATLYRNQDTLHALLAYYCVSQYSNRVAIFWWNHSYARILFPNAQLSSQRISETLEDLGSEEAKRLFFKAYFNKLATAPSNVRGEAYEKGAGGPADGILIDSTGLPNSCSLPVTAVSNHNGQVSEEVRLIYVVQQSTGLPLFFRYIAGNIIDATTIKSTISEIKTYGVNTKLAILDAGYYNGKNADCLMDAGISFITRMHSGYNVYQEVFDNHRGTLETEDNLTMFNSRFVYVKCVPCKIGEKSDRDAYAYLCLDCTMKREEEYLLSHKVSDMDLSTKQIHRSRQMHGIFMLVSTMKLGKDDVLPLYYTRNQVEDIFKLCKGNSKILPINIENESTLRGHLLMTFMATIVLKKMSDVLRGQDFSLEMLFMVLNEHRAKIFDDHILVTEATRLMNKIYNHYKLDVPSTIPYNAPENLFEEINNIGSNWLQVTGTETP